MASPQIVVRTDVRQRRALDAALTAAQARFGPTFRKSDLVRLCLDHGLQARVWDHAEGTPSAVHLPQPGPVVESAPEPRRALVLRTRLMTAADRYRLSLHDMCDRLPQHDRRAVHQFYYRGILPAADGSKLLDDITKVLAHLESGEGG